MNINFGRFGPSKVVINGQSYFGSNINIINGKVMVDGTELSDLRTEPEINIIVDGNVEKLSSENGNIICKDAGEVHNKNGNISAQEVIGPVTNKNGDIVVSGSIHGDVTNKNGDISR